MLRGADSLCFLAVLLGLVIRWSFHNSEHPLYFIAEVKIVRLIFSLCFLGFVVLRFAGTYQRLLAMFLGVCKPATATIRYSLSLCFLAFSGKLLDLAMRFLGTAIWYSAVSLFWLLAAFLGFCGHCDMSRLDSVLPAVFLGCCLNSYYLDLAVLLGFSLCGGALSTTPSRCVSWVS